MSQPPSSSAAADEIDGALAGRIAWIWQLGDHTGPAPNIAAAIEKSLAEPIEFPAVNQAIVPGDRVTLAVDATLPDLVEVVSATMGWLSGRDLESVDVVLSAEAGDELMMDLAAALGKDASVTRHDPRHRESLMYLMADDSGEAVYMNRRIADADFVLPLRTARPPAQPAEVSTWSDATRTFPRFADSATALRFSGAAEFPDAGASGFASTLPMALGMQVVLEIHPGPRGQFAGATCGTPAALANQVSQPLPESSVQADDESTSCSFVVACVDGGLRQQNWANIVRAAVAAIPRLNPSGTLVVWSSIADDPPATLRDHLIHADSPPADTGDSETPTAVNEDGFPIWSEDVHHAAAMANVIEACHVFLRGDLADDIIEELGVGVVSSAEQLSRLIPPDADCGLIRAAQFFGPDMPGR